MAAKNDSITLVRSHTAKGPLNQSVPAGEDLVEIDCDIKSASRAEWAAAGNRGLKPAFCVTVWTDEYQGETVAILNGQRYGIYRTYTPNDSETELYLHKKAGV